MAHTCPVCGSYCTCNGDIDDCCHDFDEDVNACVCCADDYEDEPCECGEMIYARACAQAANDRATAASASAAAMREALERVSRFIANGIKHGYIRMPDPALNDAASKVPELVKQALSPDSGKALLEERDLYKEALEKLARLGNEPNYGNSIGNVMAQDALAKAKEVRTKILPEHPKAGDPIDQG